MSRSPPCAADGPCIPFYDRAGLVILHIPEPYQQRVDAGHGDGQQGIDMVDVQDEPAYQGVSLTRLR
jgi:hypothetical protein